MWLERVYSEGAKMGRVKGTAMLPLVRFLRSQRGRAQEKLPSELSEYLERRILPSSWYPAGDHLSLIRAALDLAVELSGTDPREMLREFGRRAAQEHLRGIYSHLRCEDDPLVIPRRAFALWSSLHESGRFSVKLDGLQEATVRIEDFETPAPELCTIHEAYIEEVLAQSELGKPRLEKRACQNRGADACEWRVRWR